MRCSQNHWPLTGSVNRDDPAIATPDATIPPHAKLLLPKWHSPPSSGNSKRWNRDTQDHERPSKTKHPQNQDRKIDGRFRGRDPPQAYFARELSRARAIFDDDPGPRSRSLKKGARHRKKTWDLLYDGASLQAQWGAKEALSHQEFDTVSFLALLGEEERKPFLIFFARVCGERSSWSCGRLGAIWWFCLGSVSSGGGKLAARKVTS